jgi:hypothetical protein
MPIIGKFLSSGDSRSDNGQEAVVVAQPLGVSYIDLVAPCRTLITTMWVGSKVHPPKEFLFIMKYILQIVFSTPHRCMQGALTTRLAGCECHPKIFQLNYDYQNILWENHSLEK